MILRYVACETIRESDSHFPSISLPPAPTVDRMTGYGPTPWIDQFPVPIAVAIIIGGLATLSLLVLVVIFAQRVVFGPRRNNLKGRGLRNFGPADYREFLRREREEREKELERKGRKRRFLKRQRDMYGEDEEAVVGAGKAGQSSTAAKVGMGEEGSEYTLRNYREKVRAEDRRWEMQQKKLDKELAELAYAVQADYPILRR
ncbi:hypothetical protein BDM02DRAFT_3257764 [Thelephora ganbajun]|uniref:Uncharacterized protein n=1 Tax=Thelephora ganbajun TaxID=370292 RepID=A0ACB6ZVZ2_THEGA|nr:hypothetical protein BDM02DRAFT_3257764 [Thelephora ganbajun]